MAAQVRQLYNRVCESGPDETLKCVGQDVLQ